MTTIDLARRRILVVEDEAILAMDIVAEIEDQNGLADLLIDHDVPFVFASSVRRANIPARFNGVPLHTKPMKMVEAAAALMRNAARQAGE